MVGVGRRQVAKWDPTFDRKHDEICERHAVSTLVEDVVLEVVPVGQS